MKSEIRRRRIISAIEVGFGNGGGGSYNPDDNIVGVNTTSDGKQAFLVIGDSISTGAGEVVGPVTAANTLFNWNGSSLDEITTTDISSTPGAGSMWKQFAIDYKTESGYASAFYNAGNSGSDLVARGDGNDWSANGNLYPPMIVSAHSMLTFMNLTKFKGIHIILSINDAILAETKAVLTAGWNDLIDRLNSEFPDTPILLSQVGRTATSAYNGALYNVRTAIVDVAAAYENVNIVADLQNIIQTGGYQVDLLHPTQASNNLYGSKFAKWYRADNKNYNRWARGFISATFDELSSTRKGLLNTFIASQVTNGNWFNLEYLFLFKTTIRENSRMDLSYLTNYVDVGTLTFNANSDIETTGGNDAFSINWRNDISTGYRASSTDFFTAMFVIQNNVAQGTTATTFGVSGASNSSVMDISQTTTPSVVFRAGDATSVVTGETKINNDFFYGIARNGTDKFHIKGGTVSAATSQASLGVTNRTIVGGAFNNGSNINWMNGKFGAMVCGKFSTFDWPTFHTALRVLLDNW